MLLRSVDQYEENKISKENPGSKFVYLFRLLESQLSSDSCALCMVQFFFDSLVLSIFFLCLFVQMINDQEQNIRSEKKCNRNTKEEENRKQNTLKQTSVYGTGLTKIHSIGYDSSSLLQTQNTTHPNVASESGVSENTKFKCAVSGRSSLALYY